MSQNIIDAVDKITDEGPTKREKWRGPPPETFASLISEEEAEDDELSEPPIPVSKLTEEEMENFNNVFKKIYEGFKLSLGKDPTFEEIINYLIKLSNKNKVRISYNFYKQAWINNKYPNTNFDSVYEKLFVNLRDLGIELFNALFEKPSTPKEITDENNKSLKDANNKSSETVEIDENNTAVTEEDVLNRPKTEIPPNDFNTPDKSKDVEGVTEENLYVTRLTVSPLLKAAHTSTKFKQFFFKGKGGKNFTAYKSEEDELHESSNVNNLLLLLPEIANVGDVLTIKRPDNYENIVVQYWEDDITKGKTMSFKRWMAQEGVGEFIEKDGKQIPNPEFINKVPLIAYSKDGTPLFLIHDPEWYNPINIGYQRIGEEEIQRPIIQEGKANLIPVRNEVYKNGSAQIVITKKRNGVYVVGKEYKSISEMNPDAIIGVESDSETIMIPGGKSFGEDNDNEIMHKKFYTEGKPVFIVPGVAKNEYIALYANYDKLESDVLYTVDRVIEIYLTQLDKNNKVIRNSQREKNKKLADEIFNLTGLDIFEAADFEDFLKMYFIMDSSNYKHINEFLFYFEKNENIPDGAPFFHLMNGSLYYGFKNKFVSGKRKYFKIHPKLINDTIKEDPDGGAKVYNQIAPYIKRVSKLMTQSVSKEGLTVDRRGFRIKKKEEKNKTITETVIETKRYSEFLKDVLRTNIKSYPIIDPNGKIRYVTLIAPVVNYGLVKDNEKTDKGTTEIIKKIVEKKKKEKPKDYHKEDNDIFDIL